MAQPKWVTLQNAGLLNPGSLTKEQKDLIETLSDDEVDALISSKQKLGYTGTMQEVDPPDSVGALF